MPLRNRSLTSRRSIRLPGFDYRQSGAYFVTICAHQKSCLFGFITDGTMKVNDLGSVITNCWRAIPEVRPDIELDAFVVMPNHLHGIIILDEKSVDGATLPRRPKKSSSGKLMRGSLGLIIGQFKRAVTIQSKLLGNPPEQPIWQRNYYEHIIRNESSLNEIRKYIVENPTRWHDDSLYVQ